MSNLIDTDELHDDTHNTVTPVSYTHLTLPTIAIV